jgi:hypothetical protein
MWGVYYHGNGTLGVVPQEWYPRSGTPGVVPQEWYPRIGTPRLASHEGFETRGYTVLRRQVTQHRLTFSSINATSRSCHPNTADMYI